MPAQEMSNIQEYTTKHIIYDEDYFASYSVTGVLSNTSNGIIYRAERLSDGKNVVIKQVAKKTIKYFYQIHGQPCPAEFVYHFTASAGIGTDFVVKPIEWLEGTSSKFQKNFRKSFQIFSILSHFLMVYVNINEIIRYYTGLVFLAIFQFLFSR